MSILARTRFITGTGRIGLRALAVAVLWLAQAGLIAQTASTPTVQFPTVADMVAARIPATANRLTALVTGRNSTNDGGGGIFFYDSASAASTNLGTIFKPAASNGRWLRQYSGALNVKWFGAVGNGLTDDRAAFADVITLAGSNETALTIPSGTYLVASDLTFPVNVSIQMQPGSAFSTSSGVLVRFNGPFQSGLTYSLQGAGKYKFKIGTTEAVYPQWWGASGTADTSKDAGPAINFAMESWDSDSTTTNVGPWGVVRLSGQFVVKTNVQLPTNSVYGGISLQGDGLHTGIISRITNSNPIVQFGSTVAGFERAGMFSIKDLAIIGSPTQTGDCLRLYKSRFYTISNVGFLRNGQGISIYGSINGLLENLKFDTSDLRVQWADVVTIPDPTTQPTKGIYIESSGNFVDSDLTTTHIRDIALTHGTLGIEVVRPDVTANPVSMTLEIDGGYMEYMTGDFMTFTGNSTRQINTVRVSNLHTEQYRTAGSYFINARYVISLAVSNCHNVADSASGNFGVRNCQEVALLNTRALWLLNFTDTDDAPSELLILNSVISGGLATMTTGGGLLVGDALGYISKLVVLNSILTGQTSYYGIFGLGIGFQFSTVGTTFRADTSNRLELAKVSNVWWAQVPVTNAAAMVLETPTDTRLSYAFKGAFDTGMRRTAASRIRFNNGGVPTLEIDASSHNTAGDTRLLLYDVDTATLQRIKVGPNGSGPGGVGRALYLDNL